MIIASAAVIKGRLNEVQDSVNSLRNQTVPPDKIILWYSTEPYWLDDGIQSPPYIEGALWVQCQNIGCMRSITNVLKSFSVPGYQREKADYIVLFNADIIYKNNCIETSINFLKEKPDAVVGMNGLKITLKNDCIEINKRRLSAGYELIKVLQSGFMVFKPETMLKAGIEKWITEAPMASMEDELYIAGCLLRSKIPCYLLPFQIEKIPVHPLSVFNYSAKTGFHIKFSVLRLFKKDLFEVIEE